MPCSLSLNFAIDATKTLLHVKGFEGSAGIALDLPARTQSFFRSWATWGRLRIDPAAKSVTGPVFHPAVAHDAEPSTTNTKVSPIP